MSKRKIKNLLSFVLFIFVFVAIISVISSITTKETKEISSLSFSVSGVDDNGKLIKSDKTLANEELFECQGLMIEPDFESNVKYEVYYYREDKSFIGKTNVLTSEYEKRMTFDNAKYARILIIPELESGETIKFYEPIKYAKDLKITVYKNQEFEAPLVNLTPNMKLLFDDASNVGKYQIADSARVPYSLYGDDYHSHSGQTVKLIKVPVAGVANHKEDSTLTILLLNVNDKDKENRFSKVDEYKVTVPANTFKESLTYDKDNLAVTDISKVQWIEFEVNISIGENQTLAYGSENDTVYFVETVNHETNTSYPYLEKPFNVVNEDNYSGHQKSKNQIYFDLYALR